MKLLCALLFVTATAAAQQTPALSGQTQSSHLLVIRGRDGITLPAPPPVDAVPVTDNYFGTKIVDNYRWLEDARSPETQAFLEAQNAYTARYMKQARIRAQAVDDLTDLESVSSMSLPIQRGDACFYTKRLAGEQQASIYVRSTAKALPGKAASAAPAEKRLVDPAAFSTDPNISVRIEDVSRDGALVAYAVRVGGADESSIRIFSVARGKTLEDELPSARYLSVSFAPDGASFYYARHNRQGTLLFLHQLGTRVSQDKLIFGREFRGEELGPDDLFSGRISDDGRYLVVQIDRGVPARRTDIVFRDLTRPGEPFDVLVWALDARFSAIWNKGVWYVKTDYQAPKGRILKADPGILPDVWQTVVPEGADVLADWAIVGQKLYVQRLHDVKPETTVYTLAGKQAGQVAYPGIGAASGLSGRPSDRYAFFRFESFIEPPAVYRLDTVTGATDVFFKPRIPFDSSQYDLRQLFYTSKDGTRIPIFVAGRKGLRQDGSERLLMTGYGGFNLSETPYWNPLVAWWLEQGGWFALPNLRGGGEYGQQWHEQGMFEKKQNVFDDWFAAAGFLVAQKYTSPAHFAITGRSNGGLLMGASLAQRPELFAAVVCGYPLLDMLRFQKFLVGSYWTAEYGSSENESQFPYLLKYSPYQNLKARADYPAVLFFTGGSDTRVDPLHARKTAALLQAVSRGGRPVLLHSGASGGHSAGVGVDQQIQDDADQAAFLWTETGQP
jgi:prolyl oligopeptidase